MSAGSELLAQYSADEVGLRLQEDGQIVYRANGNREVLAQDMLGRVEPLLRLLGVTRVAELSALATYPYPVFQAARPNLQLHRRLGQNTGSQGKGPSAVQAKLSAIMEALESYCAEPRGPIQLVRGSFAFLREQQVVLDPRKLERRAWATVAGIDEPLMWTEACCPEIGGPLLVPAEAVFFPFLPADFATRTLFQSGTNGLASGATYLEAVTHGLYELIERHYLNEWEEGRAIAERFHLTGLIDLEQFAELAADYTLSVYALSLADGSNLPVVLCFVTETATNRRFPGSGCAGSVEVAVTRAISEAWQALSTVSSGAREDIAHGGRATSPPLPEPRTLHADEYRERVIDTEFSNLRQEYTSLRAWLEARGIGPLCIANLTRRGIDIPVTKVLVPGLRWAAARRDPPRSPDAGPTTPDVLRVRHGVPRTAGRA